MPPWLEGSLGLILTGPGVGELRKLLELFSGRHPMEIRAYAPRVKGHGEERKGI